MNFLMLNGGGGFAAANYGGQRAVPNPSFPPPLHYDVTQRRGRQGGLCRPTPDSIRFTSV